MGEPNARTLPHNPAAEHCYEGDRARWYERELADLPPGDLADER
jgi:hypothetical protein